MTALMRRGCPSFVDGDDIGVEKYRASELQLPSVPENPPSQNFCWTPRKMSAQFLFAFKVQVLKQIWLQSVVLQYFVL